MSTTPDNQPGREKMLLDPGFELTLRPMRYPSFYDRYRDAIKNTWTVEEVDLHSDVADLAKLSDGERHMIGRLVAFFATGDSIVSNNVVLSLYKHINSPEARLYLSRQLFEEAVHVQFYLTLLDTYLPDPEDRNAAFAAVENIPSIHQKAQFCFKYMNAVDHIDSLQTKDDRRAFLLNLICFAACVEGLFFYGAFAYVYWFRSRACCTAWPPAPTGCSGTSPCTWTSRCRSWTPSARRSPTSSTTRWPSRSPRCWRRPSRPSSSSPVTSAARACRA